MIPPVGPVPSAHPSLPGSGPRWRKSVHSGAQGNCVEVAEAPGPEHPDVLVRNSRFPEGPVLRLRAVEMAAFLGAIKAGQFDELLGADTAAVRPV